MSFRSGTLSLPRILSVGLLAAAILVSGTLVACAPSEPPSQQSATQPTEATEDDAMKESPAWSYQGETGPDHWGDLDPEYALCETGTEQSPIDLTGATAADLEPLVFDYRPVPVEVTHLGTTVKTPLVGAGTLTVDGTPFAIQEVHFHSPSEHTEDGDFYPLEAHLVHATDEGELAVVGVFLEDGGEVEDHPGYAELTDHLPASAGETTSPEGVELDPASLLPTERGTYRYAGSLTTPPCLEGVRWHVMVEPVQLSGAQVEALSTLIPGTNRPVQPLGDRRLVVSREAAR